HAQAQNVIEHIFGVLKQCFHILLLAPEFSIRVQAQIVSVLCATHNFMKHHDSKEGELPDKNSGHSTFEINYIEEDVPAEVVAHCDQIAQNMWESYQRILEERGMDAEDSSEDKSEDDYGALGEDEDGE
ncbi:hypothetical protein L208DRAFT_1325248, partial [Tricholoma matsutake]